MSFGNPSVLAITTKLTTYPTAPNVFFACYPIKVLGTEQEGERPDYYTGNVRFLALNLGQTVPPQGTMVLVSSVANRWVFRYDA
jgi:hypothetical protein